MLKLPEGNVKSTVKDWQEVLVTYMREPMGSLGRRSLMSLALGAGTAVGAAGSLPLPRGGQEGQLGGTYRTRAYPRISVLRGAARPLGGSGRFGVLLGEEDRGTTSHLWS